jgi:N-acetylglucosamine repressor
MRKVHPNRFAAARRGLPREINRQILLDLVRTRQPLSRADLARLMGIRRGAISLIVNALIAEGLLFEGATGEAARGRKPTFLYIDSRKRYVLAVDIRAMRTSILVTDLVGDPIVAISSLPTDLDPQLYVRQLASHLTRIITEQGRAGRCEGIGVVVPGMVDRTGSRISFAPRLGWRDFPLRDALAALVKVPVYMENSGRACALAQMWASRAEPAVEGDIAYVSVSDGLGVGLMIRGELLRGRHNVAGEFGHVPLNVDGPPCACGATGCWEAYVSNLATLSRYFGREISPRKPIPAELSHFTVDDLVARARGGDGKAIAALQATAHYLGLGLASVVNTIDPVRVYIGGEIIAAWDLIGATLRQALALRALAPAAATELEILPVPVQSYPRLRGAAALAAAPIFTTAETGSARRARASVRHS